MGSFFTRFSYSFGNEDWKTEQEALNIRKGDRVVCITGSGDRPLHLLLSEGEEVVSVDANIYQNQLLNLKAAALTALDHNQYLSFLGARKGDAPLTLYPKLIAHLPPGGAQFWNAHLGMVSKGVLYQGAIEKLCQVLAFTLSCVRRKKIQKLFEFEDLEEQRKFIREEWDTPLWRGAFSFVLHPLVTRLFVKDPGLYNHLGKDIRPSEYVCDRVNKGLGMHLAKNAAFVNLVFKGKVPERALPPYLQREGSEVIKERLPRLKTQTIDILSYLESMPDASFDAFSLSDVASYLSENDFFRLIKAILRTARPDARFCMRQFMSNHQIPPELAHHFKRDRKLEKKLETEDNCFVYRFTVGEIHKKK